MAVYEVKCQCCKKSYYFQPARGSCKINLMSCGISLCPNCRKIMIGTQKIPDIKRIE